MGKKNGAKSGGASAVVLKKHLDKKAQGKKAQPVESDNESEESGNYMTFNKKDKDSDDEEDREVFNLALDKDDDDEDVSVLLVCKIFHTCSTGLEGNDDKLIQYLRK